MKPVVTLLFLSSFLSSVEVKMPQDRTFYISGIAFDTKTYCADFHQVIQQQAAKIKALESEIAQLRRLQQQQLSQSLEATHKQELKTAIPDSALQTTKSKIIISDQPIR